MERKNDLANLKRSTAIVISIVSILAAVMFTLFTYTTKNLEIEGSEIGQVGASEMGISFEACNPSIIPVTIDGIEVNLHGSSGNYGMLTTEGKTIPPVSEETLQGTIDFTDFGTMKTIVDWLLNNESNADFNATLLVKTKTFGIIPYSNEKNYDLQEFSNVLFGKNHWSCTQKTGDMIQQLSLVQGRMSMASLIYSGQIGNSTREENSTSNLNNSLSNP